jgi:transcription initiation factor TFIIE subunit alpha
MKLSNKLVEDLVKELVGDDAIKLVDLIRGKKNVSEFKIADKLRITVNQVRNILYGLNSHNLVIFTRKKDKKKGWYIYYWTFDEKRARESIINIKEKRIEQLKKLLEKENSTTYYICPNDDTRMNAENALEHQFKCPECDQVLIQDDNVIKIDKIRNEIENLEEELKLVRPVIKEKVVKIKKPVIEKVVKKKAKIKKKPIKIKHKIVKKKQKVIKKIKKKAVKKIKFTKKKIIKKEKKKQEIFKPVEKIIEKEPEKTIEKKRFSVLGLFRRK